MKRRVYTEVERRAELRAEVKQSIRRLVTIADALFRERAKREREIQVEWATFKRLLAGAGDLDAADIRHLQERVKELEEEKASIQRRSSCRVRGVQSNRSRGGVVVDPFLRGTDRSGVWGVSGGTKLQDVLREHVELVCGGDVREVPCGFARDPWGGVRRRRGGTQTMIYPCGHDKPDQCERCDRRLIARRGFLRGAAGAAVAVAAAPLVPLIRPVMIQVPQSFVLPGAALNPWAAAVGMASTFQFLMLHDGVWRDVSGKGELDGVISVKTVIASE